MTIRDAPNWCPECEQVCHQHPTQCTVCGTTLQLPPTVTVNSNNTATSSTAAGISPIPDHLRQDARAAARELRTLIGSIRQNINATANDQVHLLERIQQLQQQVQQQNTNTHDNTNINNINDWPPIPAALLDPSNDNHSTSRPTSQAYLDKLPRITLGPQSSLLYQASLQIPLNSTNSQGTQEQHQSRQSFWSMEGILGELNYTAPLLPTTTSSTNSPKAEPTDESTIRWQLVVGDPQNDSGKGGKLSPATVQALEHCHEMATNHHNNNHQSSPLSSPIRTLLLLPRGNGVTFVQKALLAQKHHAHVCLMANHVPEPWPYLMQDSAMEGTRGGLTIPTVLLRQADAQQIYQRAAEQQQQQKQQQVQQSNIIHDCRFHLSQPVRDCVVCTDSLTQGNVVLRLPACGHVFHEQCVLQWLTKHNTCPYCRREMPTDDAEYEAERRRQQRTHAGGEGRPSAAFQDFYG